LVAPLMPGINDDPRQVEEILELATEAGATGISGIALHLRGEVHEIFMDWLRSYRPDLVEHYEKLYAGRAYAPQAEQERLQALLHRGPARPPSAFRRDPRLDDSGPMRAERSPSPPPKPRAELQQTSLF